MVVIFICVVAALCLKLLKQLCSLSRVRPKFHYSDLLRICYRCFRVVSFPNSIITTRHDLPRAYRRHYRTPRYVKIVQIPQLTRNIPAGWQKVGSPRQVVSCRDALMEFGLKAVERRLLLLPLVAWRAGRKVAASRAMFSKKSNITVKLMI